MTRAVVLAGGKGTRLKPFTFAFPKPLVPVGDAPILEILVQQLRRAGIRRVTMAVGHLAELIMAYFNDARFGDLQIEYCREPQPLGTAGPLTLVPDLDERFLVLNGDLLTTLDFQDLVAHHVRSGAVATIGSYTRTLNIDLGVLDIDEGGRLRGYIEKPTHTYRVSMGVYVFEPEVVKLLTPGARADLPDLVHRLMAAGKPVNVYPFDGFWLDIGRPEDYARAIEEFETLRPLLLPEQA